MDSTRHQKSFWPDQTQGNPGAVYQVDADGTNLHPVYAPRAISPEGVTSAASGVVAPSAGSLISIYGINLYPVDTRLSADAFLIPKTLAGVSVTANGIQLPLITVSPWQINAQLPQSTPEVLTSLQVSFSDDSTTPPVVKKVAETAPALFTYRGGVANNQTAAFHAGTGTPADTDHPASAGETLEITGSV